VGPAAVKPAFPTYLNARRQDARARLDPLPQKSRQLPHVLVSRQSPPPLLEHGGAGRFRPAWKAAKLGRCFKRSVLEWGFSQEVSWRCDGEHSVRSSLRTKVSGKGWSAVLLRLGNRSRQACAAICCLSSSVEWSQREATRRRECGRHR
jgi:hypothetical protein